MNGGNNIIIETPEPAIIKEKITRKILRPLMAQFSSLSEAILELVDNAFDEFDGFQGGNQLNIDIVITKNSITVENLGGKGMGKKELGDWLNWGDPHKTDAIGEYGQGGKAAMGYIGNSWIVQTKHFNEPWLWEMNENNWDDVSSNEKIYKAIPQKDDNRKHIGLGYCKFEIRKLKKHRQDINKVKRELSNIYRRYLDEGKAYITLNNEPIPPLKLPLYEGYEVKTFKEKIPQGLHIHGWIGRLKRDIRVKGGPRIIGGMRLLRKGRLICSGEYFGHPNYLSKASLGTLIGEVELTSRLTVLPNKTGFDTDSPIWGEINDVMHRILEPHIKELQGQRDEDIITREEKKRVSQVREIMIDAIRKLEKFSDFTSKFVEDKGRKPPTEKIENKDITDIKDSNEESVISPGKQRKPRTPSPEGAVGKLKRLGKMPDWELRDLEPNIRSAWEDKEGRRCLLINRKYCLYIEWKGDEFYIAETAALQLAKPEGDDKLPLEDYLNDVNLLVRAFCEEYNPGS